MVNSEGKTINYEDVPKCRPAQVASNLHSQVKPRDGSAYIVVRRLWLIVEVKEPACAGLVSPDIAHKHTKLALSALILRTTDGFGVISSRACQGMLLHFMRA